MPCRFDAHLIQFPIIIFGILLFADVVSLSQSFKKGLWYCSSWIVDFRWKPSHFLQSPTNITSQQCQLVSFWRYFTILLLRIFLIRSFRSSHGWVYIYCLYSENLSSWGADIRADLFYSLIGYDVTSLFWSAFWEVRNKKPTHKLRLGEIPCHLIRQCSKYSSFEKFQDAFDTVLHFMQTKPSDAAFSAFLRT